MQTSYSIDIPAVAFPGQPVDIGIKDDLSVLAVAAAIPYGVLAVRDSANTGTFQKLAGKVPALAADITTVGSALGVVVADQARAQDPGVAVPTFPINSAFAARRKGRIWVASETAVTDGAAVFVRFAAGGGGTQLGAFRNNADTASAAQLPGAIFVGKTSAAGYACVQLDLA